MDRPISFESTSVAVTTEWTDLAVVNLRGRFPTLAFTVANASGGGALSGFRIQIAQGDGDAVSYLSGVDFDATDNANMVFCSAKGPHELAAAGVALVIVLVRGADKVTFQAKSASTSTVSIYGVGSRE